jgi:hypothetical protein
MEVLSVEVGMVRGLGIKSNPSEVAVVTDCQSMLSFTH